MSPNRALFCCHLKMALLILFCSSLQSMLHLDVSRQGRSGKCRTVPEQGDVLGQAMGVSW